MSELPEDKNFELLDMRGKFYVFVALKLKIRKNNDINSIVDFFSNNLEKFKEGTAKYPGMGFKVIKKISFPENVLEDEEYKSFSEKLIVIEYIQEKFAYKKELDKQNLKIITSKKKSVVNYDKDYIFIIYPDLLIFKGSKDSYHSIWDKFYDVAKNVISVEREYTFSEDFFLKLLEKFWFKQNKIEEDFKIDFFRDLSTEGEKDFMGKLIDVRHSYDITKSLPILISFLGNKKPKSGLFDFFLKNNYYSIEITKNGSLFPRQQLGIFKNITYNERALFGCYVIYRIIKYYEKWESLDPKDKYISIEFIKSIVDFCETQGLEVFKGSISIIKQYMKIRGEI